MFISSSPEQTNRCINSGLFGVLARHDDHVPPLFCGRRTVYCFLRRYFYIKNYSHGRHGYKTQLNPRKRYTIFFYFGSCMQNVDSDQHSWKRCCMHETLKKMSFKFFKWAEILDITAFGRLKYPSRWTRVRRWAVETNTTEPEATRHNYHEGLCHGKLVTSLSSILRLGSSVALG